MRFRKYGTERMNCQINLHIAVPGLLPDIMRWQVSGPVDQVNSVVRSNVFVHRLDRAQGGVALSVVSPPWKRSLCA